MSKLKQILQSGKPPGISTGVHVDEDSVYHKAPKALKALENDARFPGGPTRTARDIGKHFSMPVDFIKSTWQKSNAKAFGWLVAAMLFLWQCNLVAGQINGGTFFVDGQTVHAADLNALVGSATITTTFYSGATIGNTPLTSDYLLLYSPTLSAYYKITTQNFLFGNTNIIGLQALKAAPVVGDSLLLYDSVGNSLAQTTVGDLLFVNGTNQFSYIATNAPTVTAVTNGDRVLVWSTGTNASDPTGANPFVASVPVQDLYPKTFIVTNIGTSVGPSTYVMNTNRIYQNLVPWARVVLVRTNNVSDSSGLLIGDEIPIELVYNANTNHAYSWGSTFTNVWVSQNYISSTMTQDLLTHQRQGNAMNNVIATSHTNFSMKVYITYFPISP